MEHQSLKKFNLKVSGVGKQPLIFAHGFGCDQNMWGYVKNDFEADYKVILFDYIGAGNSDITAYNNAKYNSLNGYADDILQICQTLELEKVIFVGHSVSCIIGILAANREPSIFERLILIGPSPRYLNELNYVGGFDRSDIKEMLDMMDKNYIGWANFLAPAIMKNDDQPNLTDQLKTSFCSTDPKIARHFAEVTFLSDNRADLQNLKIPSLILQCTDDMIAPIEVGIYLKENISGAVLNIMRATGHCPHMSAPEETIALMKEYLSQPV